MRDQCWFGCYISDRGGDKCVIGRRFPCFCPAPREGDAPCSLGSAAAEIYILLKGKRWLQFSVCMCVCVRVRAHGQRMLAEQNSNNYLIGYYHYLTIIIIFQSSSFKFYGEYSKVLMRFQWVQLELLDRWLFVYFI